MGRASRGCPPPFQQEPYGRRGHDLQRRDRLDPALRCRLAARAILSPDRRAAAARIERPRLGCGCGERGSGERRPVLVTPLWPREWASAGDPQRQKLRSEEHTTALQSLMRISYAVFCLKKKNIPTTNHNHLTRHD